MTNSILCTLTAVDKQENCEKDPTNTERDKVVVNIFVAFWCDIAYTTRTLGQVHEKPELAKVQVEWNEKSFIIMN